MENMIYDSIIIGAGSAGIAAAIYLKRKGREIALLGEAPGGQMMDTAEIENYPGFSSIQGYELTDKMTEHISSLGVEMTFAHVESVEKKEYFEVNTGGEILKGKTLIIATGARRRLLNVPGEEEYKGRGVAYCSICDAPFYRDKKVVVAGGGNSGVEAAMDLEKVASEVVLVERGELKADKILLERIASLEKIKTKTNTDILEVEGDRTVENIKVKDRNTGEEYGIPADGIFVEIGLIPNSEIAEGFVELNERKEIIVDSINKTNVEGVYACGDVTNGAYKQVVIAAGEGAKAALSCDDYLNRM